MLFLEAKLFEGRPGEDRVVINLSHVTSATPHGGGKQTLVQTKDGIEIMLKLPFDDFSEMVTAREEAPVKKEPKITKAAK